MSLTGASNTEEIIKRSAREVFIQKGLDGARMQDIADRAGINKALLHYYFRSKEKLFEIIFEEERKKFLSNITQILKSEFSIFQKIEMIVEKQIDNMTATPYLPNFIIGEIVKRPELLWKKIETNGSIDILSEFIKEVNKEVKKGTIRNITGEQLFMNILCLDIFPFVGKALFEKMLGFNEEQYLKMMNKRKKEVAAFIINAIKV